MPISIKFKKLVPEAKLPTKGKPGDAAYDLYCINHVLMGPNQTVKVRTGLQLADMPLEDGNDNLFLQIEGRSGLASRGIFPIGGIIDATYRGEIQVILQNAGPSPTVIDIKPGDRIAQIILRRTPKDILIEEAFDESEVTQTARGATGFGSSGR